jgi:hypothetical protein
MKTCSKCGLEKDGGEFNKNRNACKPCIQTYKQGRYKANKAEINAKNRAWGQANKEAVSKRAAQQYKADPEPAKARARKRAQEKPEQVRFEQQRKHLRSTYNLTLAEYDAMLEAQGGACGICSGPPTVHGRFYVDHCHATMKVRALLCHQCNVALGMMKDDPELCEKAAAYLRNFGKHE